MRRRNDERGEPLARIGAILHLIAEPVGLDHEHAVGREPAVAAREKASAHRIGQRARIHDVEAKLDRARDLVDVPVRPDPAARTKRLDELVLGNLDGIAGLHRAILGGAAIRAARRRTSPRAAAKSVYGSDQLFFGAGCAWPAERELAPDLERALRILGHHLRLLRGCRAAAASRCAGASDRCACRSNSHNERAAVRNRPMRPAAWAFWQRPSSSSTAATRLGHVDRTRRDRRGLHRARIIAAGGGSFAPGSFGAIAAIGLCSASSAIARLTAGGFETVSNASLSGLRPASAIQPSTRVLHACFTASPLADGRQRCCQLRHLPTTRAGQLTAAASSGAFGSLGRRAVVVQKLRELRVGRRAGTVAGRRARGQPRRAQRPQCETDSFDVLRSFRNS